MIHQKRTCTYAGISDFSVSAGQRRYRPDPKKTDDKSSAGHDDAAALTIYNQSFAVVRQTLPLDLKSGTNQLEITDITAHLEPDSVILRDLKSGRDLRILEQNYRSDVASQGRLLALYEGKTIEFLVPDKDGNRKLMPGKIIRSGYTPHYQAYSAYDQQYYQAATGLCECRQRRADH